MSVHLIKSCRLDIYISREHEIISKTVAKLYRKPEFCNSCSAIVWNRESWIVARMRRNVFPTCLTKDDPDKTEGQSDRRLNRGRKRLEKATSKVVATRERSGELSMHCVIARVYLLYYAHPPSLCLLYPLELYSAEEIFCWMVPRYYPAAIYSFSPLSLPLSPHPSPLSLSTFTPFISHIYALLYAHPLYC